MPRGDFTDFTSLHHQLTLLLDIIHGLLKGCLDGFVNLSLDMLRVNHFFINLNHFLFVPLVEGVSGSAPFLDHLCLSHDPESFFKTVQLDLELSISGEILLHSPFLTLSQIVIPILLLGDPATNVVLEGKHFKLVDRRFNLERLCV